MEFQDPQSAAMTRKSTRWWHYLVIPVGVLAGAAIAVMLRTSDADRITLNRGEQVSVPLTALLDAPAPQGSGIQRIAVLFGYRSCPDICPMTLFATHKALVGLGPQAQRTLVIFVTVDPERDTAAQTAAFVAFFDPRIRTISAEASVARVMQAFRARAIRRPVGQNGGYAMDHTAIVYILDAQQRVLDAIPEAIPEEQLTKRLLAALRP